MTVAVACEGLSKRYLITTRDADGRAREVERWALRDASLEVQEGEVLGVIGANGAGKSTLLKILSRVVLPTAGRARVRGRVAALLEVGTGMHPDLTGRENVHLNGALLGLSRAEVERSFDAIVEFAGTGDYLDTPIRHYSSGMRVRLGFAVAAHLAADVLIVDEVLAVGDAAFQARCLGALQAGLARGRTTLFVSHDLAAVERLCGRVALLEAGRVAEVGPAAQVVRRYLAGALGAAGAAWRAAGPGGAAAWLEEARLEGAAVQGDDLAFTVRVRVEREVKGLQLQLALRTVEGTRVASMSSGDLGRWWDAGPGSWTARVRLRDVRLTPQRYTASLRLFLAMGSERLDLVDDALAFDVQPRDALGGGLALLADRGVTWFPAEFDWSPG